MATSPAAGEKETHPYLSGNFAPIQQTLPLTLCTFDGVIPEELRGGQYVRNGGNPVANADLGRDAHWFDGDGMLSGVVFSLSQGSDAIRPEFVNQYILTDCLISSVTSKTLKSPILPSISTMVSSGPFYIIFCILRTLFLVILSHLPGSEQAIRRISVANTGIFYHDGRALATCESGPPMRILLPTLDTVGWYDGSRANGEPAAVSQSATEHEEPFGGSGLLSFMKEWTTGHPKVDPTSGEMILYHSTFTAPYIHYSVLPVEGKTASTKVINAPVPGVSGAKMAHDFGVSLNNTVIMDLSLILNPFNILKSKPVVQYDSSMPARFGVFPRQNPASIRWFQTRSCCIFHTANTWDQYSPNGDLVAVNMLACRLTSASVVYSAGNISIPPPSMHHRHGMGTNVNITEKSFEHAPSLESEMQPLLIDHEEEQCRLYYYSFDMQSVTTNTITQQFALSAIPFEFPTLHPEREMSEARYIYGCSTSLASFDVALGRSVKIDVLAKIDALTLIQRAKKMSLKAVTGCVDARTVPEVLQDNLTKDGDTVTCFKMPDGWYAQEARFVPRRHPTSEDDGYLLFYAFDESQLDSQGECLPDAVSELWILDAKSMRDVLCRIALPQRVPYGLHGQWFTSEQIDNQRGVDLCRQLPASAGNHQTWWRRTRDRLIALTG